MARIDPEIDMNATTEYTVELIDCYTGSKTNQAYPMVEWLSTPGTLAHFVESFDAWGAWGLDLESDDQSDNVIAVVTDPAGRDLDVCFRPVK